MKYSLFLFSALIFLGAGCSVLDQAACIGTTPWGSCVTEDGMDQALLGNWILDEQTISKNGQTVGNPFHGRKLSIVTSVAPEGSVQDVVGRFQEDFSSEIGGSGSVAGVTSTCTSSGGNQGTIIIGVNTSTPLVANSIIPSSALTLFITSEGSTNEVECSAGGSTFSSNNSSIALGEGFSTTGSVSYEYFLSDDWQDLTLVHQNPANGVNINYLFHAE
ncbi:MAG: hypothetical protein O2877_00595 [bacterium]|nr:hypothetical protein [bacterium]